MIWSIAAGNAVVLKPSEMTPAMSKVISEIVSESFHSNLVSVIQGDASVARYLTQQPFDHIFFTGSPAVGKQVMAEAAKNLSSVTLELGGKSPVIIDSTADLKKAAQSISFGKFANNGQTCIAPDYIYVHQSVKQAFLNAMTNSIQEQYGNQDKLSSNSDYCRIVNQAHFQRISGLISSAVEEGASIYQGGESVESQCFIAPTILTEVNPDSEIMQQEIFGPVLPVLAFSDIDKVIATINSNPKPLALYVFSKQKQFTDKVIQQTSAGDSAINATVIHILHQNLPFGGVNNSGIGKVGGVWGYQAFSHQRSIVDDKLGLSGMLSPPYTPKVKRMVKSAISFLT
jgi:aldehyde dehydrogenase (NAD+)